MCMDQHISQSFAQKKKSSLSQTHLSHKIGTGIAHSKIILMGEHSVVYDYPAIAMPFPKVNICAVVSESITGEHTISSEYYHGNLSEIPEGFNNIKHGVQMTLDSFKLPHSPLHIDIQSTIPIGRGMGSSAAVVVSIVRAICDYYDQVISNYQLHFIVNEAEVIAHESTSGIDTLMTSTDDPIIYRKSHTPKIFELNMDAYLIVADSGQEGRTRQAVSHVRQLKESRPAFVKNVMASMGNFATKAYEAILQNNPVELGRLMTYNHYYLNQLEISNSRLDSIINAAWLAGALGAKLTGGGLGGCVIALAASHDHVDKIEAAMKQAGACQTWSMSLKKESKDSHESN